MKERLLKLGERIDGMEPRQRILLLIGALVLLFYVADSIAIQPALRQQQASKQAIRDIELRMNVLRQRSGLLDDPSGRSLYHDLQDTLAELDSRIEARVGGLLAPDQAIEVLKQVLAQEQELELHAVNAGTLAMEETDPDDSGLARYRVSLQLEGSYLATLRYLHALERLPWTFYWEGIEYEVTEHPRARLTLDIYTLGYPGEDFS